MGSDNRLVSKKAISRFFRDGGRKDLEDTLIKESRLDIRLDGKEFVRVVISPSQTEEFVIGFLSFGLFSQWRKLAPSP